jgi:outer membrane protein OmpU
MKNLLLATSALVLWAGAAAAEVKIGGTARAGIVYGDPVPDGVSDTIFDMRLRFNIDVSKELDSGVTLGGRIRMQYDDGRTQDDSGEGGAELNAAYLYAEAGGIRVEVGNANTALDSMATLYNAELGYTGTTLGSYALANYAAYETSPYSSGQANRMGVFAQYEAGGLVARFSYLNPDQTATDLDPGVKEELSLSFDYTIGAFSVGIGAAWNGNFVDDNDVYALTGEYAFNDSTAIGLQFIDNGSANSTTTTLYGRTAFANGIGLGAFISGNDDDDLPEDFAVGIGFNYDLGGATLAGTIQRGFFDETFADLGINFSF